MPPKQWIRAPIWVAWRDLTRLQWSGRLAFANEVARLSDATGRGDAPTSVELGLAGGRYETSTAKHVAALADEHLFCSLILLRSYSLMESHAKFVHHAVAADPAFLEGPFDESALEAIEDEKLLGGVAAWSTRAIDETKQDWALVYGGRQGLIEISLVRNALAHGHVVCGRNMIDQFEKHALPCPFEQGEKLLVDFARLHEYRGRIRSFCRVVGDGLIHLKRGTHRRDVADD